jgi:RHS repeat-associated protein
MNGISSKALNFGNPENEKFKFQNQEFNNDLGIDYYEFKYRYADPQLGRFFQIDPLSNDYVYNSTYAFSENKVTSHVELEGLESSAINPQNTDPRVRAAMNESVQRKVIQATNTISNSVEVKVNVGLGVGITAKVGPVGGSVEANGPQVQFSTNLNGKIKVEGSVASAGVNANCPLGEAGAGITVAKTKFETGILTIDALNSDAFAQVKVEKSKEVKQEGEKLKGSVDSDGDLKVGAKIGIFGILIKFNASAILQAAVEGVGAWVSYKVEEVKQSTNNPLINPSANNQ